MLDMKSMGRVSVRCGLLAVLAGIPLSGCKTIPFMGTKTAAVENEESKAVADAAEPPAVKGKPQARPNIATTAPAYVDPSVNADNVQIAADSPPQALPGSQAAPQNIGGMVTQPTGINAFQSSIFSSGRTVSAQPVPSGPDGAVLPASAYSPAPGVNAMRSSVYGSGNAPTGAASSEAE